MTKVDRMVETVVRHGQPGLALTDHGGMPGIVSLYQNCRKHDIKPFPGVEGYLLDPHYDGPLEDMGKAKAKRYHLGLMALDEKGYKGLVKLISKTHTRPRFNFKPHMTLFDLAEFGEDYGRHTALTTGCFFGLVQQMLAQVDADEAKRMVKMYSEWFPNTFVEVQNHSITDENELGDKFIVKTLMDIADELGLPVIATQDSHYCEKDEKVAHDLMKRMTYGGADDSFPGDFFHLSSTKFVQKHYKPKQWDRFEEGYSELLDLNKLRIKPLDRFKVDVPGDWKDPMKVLRKKCEKSFVKLVNRLNLKGKKLQKYRDELDEQLSVIEDLGMPGYFLIWDTFIQWCRRKHICVEARGSANGSLPCYLLGITQVDPIYWGCRADRFLSRDRIKAPDIDLDIEDERRMEAIRYLIDLLDAVQIGTWGQLGITVDPETGEEKGSVLRTWIQWKRRECEEWAKDKALDKQERTGKRATKKDWTEKGKARFAKKYGHVERMKDVKSISEEDYRGLVQIHTMKSVYRSYGTHAGGVLLSGNKVKIKDYIPTMLVASSDTVVSQYDMDAVEEFGLLKMDILGQTSLTVMRKCQQLIGREDPTDFEWIPNDDPAALKELRSGRMNTGIFHFEAYVKSKGGREVGVKSIRDAILVQALYMPGCLDVAPGQNVSMKDLYIHRRRNPEARRDVEYIHPVFEKALSPTYGCVVFQEQVIQIMRDLGMDIAGVNKFFKVVKDSGKGAIERNQKRMAEVRSEFDRICKKNGVDPDEAWSQTAAFVAYGFNKNHATGYGLRSYRTAYLRAHYPLEWMTCLLETWAGKDSGKEKKEPKYIRETKRMGMRILPPDINVPAASWTMDKKRNGARRGLVSVRGIGPAIADEIAANAPFKDLDDLAERCNGQIVTGINDYRETGDIIKGTLLTLDKAGVLDSLKG